MQCSNFRPAQWNLEMPKNETST